MFNRLFADSGLSLERLRALVEVGAAGSIAKAVGGDAIRQSQYSRQIKELEDFFQAKLVERHGKGIRLTASGKELARISRFFLLGLSNFQRGCLAEEQTFRLAASATFSQQFLLPTLAKAAAPNSPRYFVETASDDEIERRLHDLTLDFGIVASEAISRPLQMKEVGKCHLSLYVPWSLARTEKQALALLKDRRLPLALVPRETPAPAVAVLAQWKARLTCANFFEARNALELGRLAALLPDFLAPAQTKANRLRLPELASCLLAYRLAWNPRLLRLNPHAARRRDFLIAQLTQSLRK